MPKRRLSEFSHIKEHDLYIPDIELYNKYEYSDGDAAENYIIESIDKAQNLGSSSRELISFVKDWPSRYHFSPQRGNIIRVLDLPKKSSVLEIGSGMGAVTRYLGENFEKVDSIEGSLRRALATKKRTRDIPSVNVFVSDYNNINFENNYDVLTLIGVLEYASHFDTGAKSKKDACLKSLLHLKNALNDEGTLVIAIENRLGLKYWSGAGEDHTNLVYDSIYGYPRQKSPVTFSETELRSLLTEAGFGTAQFYYTFPDYKLPSVFFSERVIENENNIHMHNWLVQQFFEDYSRERVITFQDQLAARALAQDNILHRFANSFLVVVKKEGARTKFKKPKWTARKINVERHEQFQTKTDLIETTKNSFIKKNMIARNLNKSSDLFDLNFDEQTEYKNGDLLIFKWYEAIAQNLDFKSLYLLLDEFRAKLITTFSYSEYDKDGYRLIDGRSFDFVPWNIVVNREGWNYIDDEWKLNFNLPEDYVVFRAISRFLKNQQTFICTKYQISAEGLEQIQLKFLSGLYPEFTTQRYEQLKQLEQFIQRYVQFNDNIDILKNHLDTITGKGDDSVYGNNKNQNIIQQIKEKYLNSSGQSLAFAIKIGVPSRAHKNWGDVFYAQSLQDEIIKNGNLCTIHYLDEWENSKDDIDIVIHLKGLSKYNPQPNQFNIIWIINHPELHTIEELNSYQMVFCASKKYFNEIKDKVSAPCHYLPQAANENIYKPNKTKIKKDIDVLFVGNNYEAKNGKTRKVISDMLALKNKSNFKIVGENWENFVDPDMILSTFIEYDQIPDLYSRAKIILNDHQETMAENGFINNRTFDIALMKELQISNPVTDISDFGITTYNNLQDLEKKLNLFLNDDELRQKTASENYKKCKNETFMNRAKEIDSFIKDAVTQPEITILMTTYNRRNVIRSAIDSVLRQTFKDWELIIINDGGEDVQDVAESYNDPRIKYFNNAHSGKANALNFAIENSLSEYIAYLDDDDTYFPDHLAVLMEGMQQNPKTDFVYTVAEEAIQTMRNNQWVVKDTKVRFAQQATQEYLRYHNCIPNLTVLHRRNLFNSVGLYDQELKVLIDWDMFRRLSIVSSPVLISKVTCRYFRKYSGDDFHSDQITGLYQNKVTYYRNRLRITNKPHITSSDQDKNCMIIANGITHAELLIPRLEFLKKTTDLENFIFIVDSIFDENAIKSIMKLEGYMALCIWNDKNLSELEFLEKYIANNEWAKYIYVNDVKYIEHSEILPALDTDQKVVLFSAQEILLKDSVHYLNLPKKQIQFDKSSKVQDSDIEVSIIIPVFNKLEFTKTCIASIYQNTSFANFEIMVIDNGSSDGTSEYLKKIQNSKPNLNVIYNSVNQGFSKANNQGSQIAKGEYLLFLNNDTEVLPGWLSEMMLIMANDPSVGCVGSKLLFADGTIQHAGVAIWDDRPDNGLPMVARHIYYREKSDFPEANELRQYQVLTGACLLTRKSLYSELNGFDERFWNGYEDVDYCLKVQEKDYKLVYQPKSVVMHYESQSGDERFTKVNENITLLLKLWTDKIQYDVINNANNPPTLAKNHKFKKYQIPIKNESQVLNDKLISIIMLTFNALEYTKKCVDSILTHTKIPYEIIFVDNNSTDDTKKYLRQIAKENDHVTAIFNKKNKGFAAANNQGVKCANGEYVMLLNNDVLVADGWLQGMVTAFEKDSQIGMVGPLTNSISGLQMVSDVDYKDENDFYTFAAKFQKKFSGNITPRRRIAGFAVLMKKSLYEDVKGFDVAYGTGNYEDDDLCLKVRNKGYAIVVDEGTFIHHYGSQTFKANKIDILKSLEDKGNVFKQKWPDVDYEELLEMKNPLSKLHVQLMNQAIDYLKIGDFENAILSYKQILTDHPVHNEALLGAAMCSNQVKEFDIALLYLNKLIQLEPENANALNQSGVALMGRKDPASAKTAFALAIEKDPQLLDAQRNYADSLIESNDYENGIQVFNKILENHPNDIASLLYLADLNYEAGRNDECGEYIDRVLGVQSDHTLALKFKALLEKSTDSKLDSTFEVETNQAITEANEKLLDSDTEAAKNIYNQVLKVNPEHVAALYGLAIACHMEDKLDDSRNHLVNLVKLEPEFKEAHTMLGNLALLKNTPDQAIQHFKSSLNIDNNQPDVYNTLANALIESEDYEAGIQLLVETLKDYPDHITTLKNLGLLNLEAGNDNEALVYFKRILDNDPGETEIASLIQSIKV